MIVVDALLDTNVLIDISRQIPVAVQWMQTQSSTVFGLPVLVCMELIDGVQNQLDRQRALKVIQQYPVIHLYTRDSKWAQAQHTKFKLSHNVGIGDALIASASARLKVPIYTLNTKHFSPLPDVQAIRPY